jgi:hypothetical protein
MKVQEKKKFIRNTSGMISADFIFSLTLCAGLCIVFFSLTFTLSMSEVAQYIAFSVARAHAAGHIDPDKQNQMGMDKYKEILSYTAFKNFITTGSGGSWFVLERPVIKSGKDGSDFSSEYPINLAPHAPPFSGVKILFKPTILNKKIPFLGSTSENPDEGFSAYLTSFIFREPSQVECLDQVKERNTSILGLSNRYSELGRATSDKYIPLEDNGC